MSNDHETIRVPSLASAAHALYSGRMTSASEEQLREWEAEFEAAARRPLKQRLRYAFIHTYKPVLDDASYGSFDSMADYRRWCEADLPRWLGYGREI